MDYEQARLINEYSEKPKDVVLEALQAGHGLSLSLPRSRCPKCSHLIRWFENVPVLSWLLLGGKCRGCKTKISVRYPLVEAFVASVWVGCFYIFGVSVEFILYSTMLTMLVALTLIDYDHKILPNSITIPLLFLGLLYSTIGDSGVSPSESIQAATAIYVGFYVFINIYEAIRGIELMGRGDFVLFAAGGAWFGFSGILPMILVSSLFGLVGFVLVAILNRNKDEELGKYQMPFGPSICLAMATYLFYPDLVSSVIS